MSVLRRHRAPGPEPTYLPSPSLGALGRLGRWVARRHRWVGVVWLVVLIGAGAATTADQSRTSDDFRVPGADSQAAYDLLQRDFRSQNDATATVVLEAPRGQRLTDPGPSAGVAAAVAALEGVPGVRSVSDPLTQDPVGALDTLATEVTGPLQAELRDVAAALPPSVSADGRVALVTVTFDAPLTTLMERVPARPHQTADSYENPYSQLVRALDRAELDGVRAEVGGAVADTWNQPVSWLADNADAVGLALGAVLLLVAFGSLFGMVVPIVTALFGAVTAGGLVYLLATVIDVSSAAPPVTLMISIGVGLDYSLLIVTRYRQFLADGYRPHDAAGLALSTSGRAALFAGITVCIALLGLLVVPIPLVQTMGLAAAVGVATMIVAALTLLPCLLGFAGAGIDRIALHRASGPSDPATGFWGRFAARIARRPLLALVGGTAALLVLAAPFLRIQFGMPGDDSLPRSLSQHQAYVLTEQAFGAGANGPLVAVVGLPEPVPYTEALQQVSKVSTALGALRPAGTVPGIRYSVGPIPDDAARTTAVIYQLVPETGPDSPRTAEVVRDVRDRLQAAVAGSDLRAHVGGATATLVDLTDLVVRVLPLVIGAVVLGAFLLLLLVFRSVLVPLKAALLNLVSIGAAYGVVVAVFQLGWAKGLIGLDQTIPIVSFVPLIMFVILFGLSMDYEVFLMSRIREEWNRTGDARNAVVRGVGGTARVITTAALIMIAVFLSFVTNPSPTVKLIGFGMAVAVLLDSTVVRMVLVPAVMELFGPRAWWFPSWLSWLPRLDVEGDVPAAGSGPPDGTDGRRGGGSVPPSTSRPEPAGVS